MEYIEHYIIRIGNGENFHNSTKDKVWCCNENFMKKAKTGDILWFVPTDTSGKVIAVATFVSASYRNIGVLINADKTDKEYGWTNNENNWKKSNYIINYINLYDIEKLDLFTHVVSRSTVFNYYSCKCDIDLPTEYLKIKKYGSTSESISYKKCKKEKSKKEKKKKD
jgi:hypothetical protein